MSEGDEIDKPIPREATGTEENVTKSAVDRPWKLTFLGHTMTRDRSPRLRVAPRSEQRLKNKLREIFRKGRGRNIERVIKVLNTIDSIWKVSDKHAENTAD